MSSDYHHGELPDSLRAATVELVAERGPTGFSLREVARRAGVSHAAPKYHFGGAQGLLTSVAIEGFQMLTRDFQATAIDGIDARTRLTKIGLAYVHMALTNPGHFGVMMQSELIESDNPECIEAAEQAHGQLMEAVEALRDELNPDLDTETAATLCWATMHGLVELRPKLASAAELDCIPIGSLDETVIKVCKMLVDGLAAR